MAGLDEAAVPALLDYLSRNDAQMCANAEAALSALTRRWGLQDGRTLRFYDDVMKGQILLINFFLPTATTSARWRPFLP